MTATLNAEGHLILPPEINRAAQAHPARRYDVMVSTLTGQCVAVIGAANGIGRAIAGGFISEGCRVRGFDRDLGFRPLPPGGEIQPGDATSFDQVQVFADAIGDVDHVVFCVDAGSGKFEFSFWNLGSRGLFSSVAGTNISGKRIIQISGLSPCGHNIFGRQICCGENFAARLASSG